MTPEATPAAPVGGNRPHGYSRYTAGCRCDECRAAKAAYMRDRRHEGTRRARWRQSDQPIHPFGKGSVAAYTERGCRCFECREAIAARRALDLDRQRTRQLAVSA